MEFQLHNFSINPTTFNIKKLFYLIQQIKKSGKEKPDCHSQEEAIIKKSIRNSFDDKERKTLLKHCKNIIKMCANEMEKLHCIKCSFN
jgi:hypothetical protein